MGCYCLQPGFFMFLLLISPFPGLVPAANVTRRAFPDEQWHPAIINQTLFFFLFQAYVGTVSLHFSSSLPGVIFFLSEVASTGSVNAKSWQKHNLGCQLPFLFKLPLLERIPLNVEQTEHVIAQSKKILYNSHNSASPCLFVFAFHLFTASAPEIEVLLENLNFH